MKRTALRRRRSTPRRSGRVRDTAFMLWVRTLPCAAYEEGRGSAYPCAGDIEADHTGRRPMGRKADDDTCIAMCQQHHKDRADFAGCFKGWTGSMMRAWLAEQIEKTQALWAKQQGRAA